MLGEMLIFGYARFLNLSSYTASIKIVAYYADLSSTRIGLGLVADMRPIYEIARIVFSSMPKSYINFER